MRTFPIKSIWLKTVFKTDLEDLSPEQILDCLVQHGLAARVGADRYTLIKTERFASKSEFKDHLLAILRGYGHD